ncbi:MAG TPA: hypothetical protein VFL72_05590 [Acidimicrobiia bacterium]|nr:hypothetical protein [Acidimicrobiia bacterium]
MSRDLDTIARRAAENLKAAVETAPLHHRSAPVAATPTLRPSLRLALVTAALLLSSAVAVALVLEVTPEPVPPTTPTSISPPSTLRFPEPAPLAPATTVVVTTTPPPTTLPPDTTPPALAITSPEDGAEVEERELTFSGTTEPGALVTAGKYEAEVGPDGSWSIMLILAKGANHVVFEARDSAGNETRASVNVLYVVAEATTTTTKPVEQPAEFKANATFGVCTSTPPFDVYYGIGKPGSTVYVQSEYGSGAVVVGEEGGWELQVFFNEAPANQAFPVKVYDDLGREKMFEFRYQPEG